MNTFVVTATLTLLAAPLAALADPPQTLHVVEVVHIKAPLDRVWDTARNFDALDKWHPALAKDELVKGANNEPGAVRALTIKDGPTIKEELISFDEAHHAFVYKIIDSPFPLAQYRSHFSVTAGKGGTTTVHWSGTFKRKNPADNPPEGQSDAAAIKLVTGIYRDGLANLKKILEN